jgi:hypothetical protein
MNVEIGTEAAQFPEKEYINGIFVAVWAGSCAESVLLNVYGAPELIPRNEFRQPM